MDEQANVQDLLEYDAAKRDRIVELLAFLSPQAVAFIFAYVKTLDIKRASREAGVVYSNAYSLLRNPRARELMGLLLENQITKEEIVGHLIEIIRFDYGDLLQENPDTGRMEFNLAAAKDAGQSRFIKSYRYGKQGSSVEVYDKMQALSMLAKILGMLDADGNANKGAITVLVDYVKKEIKEENSDA